DLAHVRLCRRIAGRRPAGVRVLDDDGSRLREFERDPRSRIEVEEVRVRKLLALKDRRLAKPAATGSATGTAKAVPYVPRSFLMQILAVPEVADFHERDLDGVAAGHRFVGHRFSGAALVGRPS